MRTLSLSLAILALASPAAADTLIGTGNLVSGVATADLSCYVTNYGKKPVEVRATLVVSISAGILVPFINDCDDGPLQSGSTCLFAAIDPPGSNAAGAVRIKGNAKEVRGRCIMAEGSTLYDAGEMR